MNMKRGRSAAHPLRRNCPSVPPDGGGRVLRPAASASTAYRRKPQSFQQVASLMGRSWQVFYGFSTRVPHTFRRIARLRRMAMCPAGHTAPDLGSKGKAPQLCVTMQLVIGSHQRRQDSRERDGQSRLCPRPIKKDPGPFTSHCPDD